VRAIRLDDVICWLKSKEGKPFDGVPKFLSFKEWKAWDELFRTALLPYPQIDSRIEYQQVLALPYTDLGVLYLHTWYLCRILKEYQ
jgi:hypothetical protein